MEQTQISLELLAKRLNELEIEVRKLKAQKEENIEDDWRDIHMLSERSLADSWLSPEDEKAFAYLQDEI